jgi:Cd2+/Zn2+-exporting ATPase
MGSDAPIEAANIALMDDDLQKITRAVQIAQKTLRIVRENIILALGIKFAVLILAAFGIANMWMTVVADVGVCLVAILNALRALKG